MTRSSENVSGGKMPQGNRSIRDESRSGERLQVVLARAGLASRRGVISLIESGRVSVNGVPIKEKGYRVLSNKDKIEVDGQLVEIRSKEEKYYYMLNKPKNVTTTLQDPHAERTVADYFNDLPYRLYPVGRLDRDTTGLLLVTNDGELAFRLSHPSFGIDKKYRAFVSGDVKEEEIRKLERGVSLDEGRTAPCRIEKIKDSAERPYRSKASVTGFYVTLHEGKKRQIRRMFDKIGHRVVELERIQYGPIGLGRLPAGMRKELTAHEIGLLKRAVGLSSGTRKDPTD